VRFVRLETIRAHRRDSDGRQLEFRTLKLVRADEQLGDLKNQLNEISLSAQQLVSGLYSYQLNLRPEPDLWSIAECLVHLNLTSAAFIPIIRNACAEDRSKDLRSDNSFTMDWTGRLLKWSLNPPPRLKVSTIPAFQPTLVEPIEAILPRFLELQAELSRAVDESRGLDLNRVNVRSPFSARIRYNLFSCFSLVAAHERRHIWQAEQVKNQTLET